jgi:hypothetical protein
MRILELEIWRVSKTGVVCENHFKLTDMTGTERKRLIATAKPLSAHDVLKTIYLWKFWMTLKSLCTTLEKNLVLSCTVYRWHALEFSLELMQSR